MRNVIVVFNNELCPKKYHEETKHLLWQFFLKHFNVWHEYVDKLYVLDYLCCLEVPSWVPLSPQSKIEIIDNFPRSNHYESLEWMVPQISKGNDLLILDSDTVIYDKNVVKDGFESLKEYDAVGSLTRDGCCPKFKGTILEKNEWRDWRGKLSNWITFVRGKWAEKGKFFPVLMEGGNEEYYDPLTTDILENGGTIKELKEDCWKLLCGKSGKIYESWYEHADANFWEGHRGIKNVGFFHILRASHIRVSEWTLQSASISDGTVQYDKLKTVGFLKHEYHKVWELSQEPPATR